MQRLSLPALFFAVGLTATVPASASPLSLAPEHYAGAAGDAPVQYVAAQRPDLGGGFIEFLFGGLGGRSPSGGYGPSGPQQGASDVEPQDRYGRLAPGEEAEPALPGPMDPKFERQEVAYTGDEPPGTIIIDTPHRFLYLVESGGRALRYGIGVGRPGFTWAGVHRITAKREWPDWTPPEQMLRRRPDLPRHMAGGPDNPLGARAMYLGSTLYRIHGSNEPWTIGHAVSSGCIRLRNQDVIDLYGRVKVGTKVVVL
jgi:lipoprotein-anchoring transpeptidase ErfK/SrfK